MPPVPLLVRDPKNDGKKCGNSTASPNRVFKLTGSEATTLRCYETCAFSSEIADCVAVSGVHKKWCIGCKVELNAPHKGAVAFRMQDDQDGNYLS